jgi:adenylylsulfate kinase
LKGLTGIDDPYEAPLKPDMVLHTVDVEPPQNAAVIASYLVTRGLLAEVR